jgi:signal transduction protein with GAF and PtsI domain
MGREKEKQGKGNVTENQTIEGHIEAMTRISKAITSDRYIEDILRLVVTVTAETMRSKICSLWLLDGHSNALTLRATQSMSEDYLKERSLKMGEGIVGQVALTGTPRAVINVLEEPDYKEKDLARKEGLVSMLSVPMVVKDKVIGVINCYTSSPHKFTETEQNVLITVANEAAVAIENTELMVKTKVIQEELESRKLIERAKDVLIARRGLSGVDAYRLIQKRSMDTRKSMREIAEAILLTEEI